MGAKIKIKIMLAENELSLSDLANLLDTSLPNLSKKLNNNTIRYNEVEEIAELLGYEIIFKKSEENNSSKIQRIKNILHKGNGDININ